ncbi:MAG: hypothetical protein K2X39_08640 [Silvanigrellaceae bacterium]|nr:hypothetical protein [Silvanigrellaceae bacterium]
MAKKKFTKPDINNLIDSVLKNIDAVRKGESIDLTYLTSFQVGMSLAKSMAPLLPSEDHKTGFASGIQSFFAFDIGDVQEADKDPPLKSDADPEDDDEDYDDRPF